MCHIDDITYNGLINLEKEPTLFTDDSYMIRISTKWKNESPQLDKWWSFTYVEGCKTNTNGAPTLKTRVFVMKHVLKFIFGNSNDPAIIKNTDDVHTLGCRRE